MSLWGNKDTVYSTGNVTTIAITNGDGVITASGSTWNEGNGVVPGLVITMGAKGSGVIKSVDSTTQLTLVGATGLTAEGSLTQSYNISEQPKSLVVDSNYDGNEIYGVDTTEQSVANAASGEARQYAPAHAGWVGITTYVDNHGSLRVKTETLVAGSTITGDAEDTKFPDS
jgi:hypothetical protein|tara:strand:- start:262 stop:774 length:513 start_codon:yes stop_codon:yes gene_type:complete